MMMEDERDHERAPLLKSDDNTDSGSSNTANVAGGPSEVEGGIGELPPPYTAVSENGIPMVKCRVCDSVINLEGKEHQHVVKCGACNEATAIKPAPPGKKYVRCPCNCLLICKVSSQRIACPRSHCKRIIDLSLDSQSTSIPVSHYPVPGSCRVVCGHCHDIFLFNTLNNALARCPSCHKVSTVGPSFARRRATLFGIIGFIFICAGIGVTVGTYEIASRGYFVIWIVLYLLGVLMLSRGLYYLCMRVSHIQGGA